MGFSWDFKGVLIESWGFRVYRESHGAGKSHNTKWRYFYGKLIDQQPPRLITVVYLGTTTHFASVFSSPPQIFTVTLQNYTQKNRPQPKKQNHNNIPYTNHTQQNHNNLTTIITMIHYRSASVPPHTKLQQAIPKTKQPTNKQKNRPSKEQYKERNNRQLHTVP